MRVNIIIPNIKKNDIALKADSIFNALVDDTPEQIKDWVDKNTKDTTEIRKILTLLLIELKSRT